jgi:hypothetical protein
VTAGASDDAARTRNGIRGPLILSRLVTRSPLAPAPVAIVLASSVALWLAGSVSARDVAIFFAYEVAFVAMPGWLLYRVLAPEDSFGRTLVFGWALGYVVEIGAYIVLSSLGGRGFFAFYPLLFAPVLIAVRRGARASRTKEPGPSWALAIAAVASLAYLGLSYFAKTPLPWRVPMVTYFSDIPYHLTLAAEALHHWPMVDPNVSGTGLYYHVWAHLNMAATTSVTGISLVVVLFRLALIPLVLLFIAEIAVAARTFSGRRWVGPVSVALVLLVGEVDVQPWDSYPFLGLFFVGLWYSPTFLLGLVFFLPAITLLAERISSDQSVRLAWKRWLLIALFLLGCGGAKATILSVILGALLLTIVVRWSSVRRVGANAGMALGMTTATFLLYYLAIYRHSALGLSWDPLGSIAAMGWITDVRRSLGHGLGWPVGIVLGTLGLFGAQLAGLPALIALRWKQLDVRRLFLLALFAAGLVPFFLLHQPGNSQLFFSHYGLVAAALLSAEGIVLLATMWPARMTVRAVATIMVATAATIVLLVSGVDTHFFGSKEVRLLLAIMVLAASCVAVWRWSSPSGRRNAALATGFAVATSVLLVLWWSNAGPGRSTSGYVLIAVLLGGTASAALLSRGFRRREYALALILIATTAGALDVPLDVGPEAIGHIQDGTPFYDRSATGLTRGLYEGLEWIRTHTSDDAVLAVNNYYDGSGSHRQPTYVDYGAFAERRVFLEGWLSNAKSWNSGANVAPGVRTTPFRYRLDLNNAVFLRADQKALSVLVHQYGVRYLVDDRVHGTASKKLRQLATVAYENPGVIVYAVPASS